MDEKRIEEPPAVFDSDTAEEIALKNLGYDQQLKRSFSLIGIIGFSFSIVTCWSALSGVLIIGAESGGPPVMIWSWIGVCVLSLAVAYSMAEMCSAYPVAGGQYSWAAVLAPKQWARPFSFVCGWFMLIGIMAMAAQNNIVTANWILGIANLNNPDYTVKRWHTSLSAFACGLLSLCINVFGPRLLEKISKGLLVWNIVSFITIVVVILAVNDHKQSPSFVFKDFVNLTGFGPGYTAIIGILQSAFGMCCYDAPSHMVEELHDARKQAPRAIVLSVYVGALTGFVFLLAACFCIGDIETTASSPTGVPMIEILYNSTNKVGASIMTVLLTVIFLGSGNALTAEGGRAVYAFARDHGLPFSEFWSKVEPKKQIPVAALCLSVAVQFAFDSIYFGSSTGFLTVVSIATEGFYVSYAMPLLARLVSLALPSTRARAWKIEGGLYSLGAFSIPLNVIGLLYLVFTSVTFNLPTVNPVTSENMNYNCAAVGVIMAIACVTWFTKGHKDFKGPESSGVVLDKDGGDAAVVSQVLQGEKGESAIVEGRSMGGYSE